MCLCRMFQTEGICWHTGYQPTFREPAVHVKTATPPAVQRSRERLMGADERKERKHANG